MIIALQTLVFFRESLFTALDRVVRPYYKQLSLGFFTGNGNDLEDEDSDDQVFSEYDEEKGVTFFPPMYAQRYAAVSDCLLDDRWSGNIEKIVDFGHHDMSFIKYLKEVPGIRCILGVDIETIPLRCSSDLLGGDEYSPKRESPLKVTLFQGNAADPDYRLIGCDAVIAIEMIEHMLPHDLERFVHTVFGFIKPRVVIFTTPNADFNILFKALEKNGLRRLDHLFEWTREQFHDWCSNIVARYPNYMVTCKGIGPGPPGALHHGCCSQLSLFIAKEYNKQADLNINSLASQLVGNGQNRNNFSEIFEGCWESSASLSQQPPADESMTEILYPEGQSHMTLVFSSTLCNSAVPLTEKTFTMGTFSNRDQTLQCNLDVELGKSFMMFDCQDYYNVMVPRRRVCHKVYEIEDVCSSQAEDGGHIWCNINWGDNAPYWNQYYKIVREYAYPFETKSEESRILDLVSEEINRRLDNEYDEEFSVDVNRLEIPLSHLMAVLQHITQDIDRVRDLLEWNGYEIVDDVVIHSRLVVDTTSVATHDEEWQEHDFSDWDTGELRSPSESDGSTIVPDLPGRCLRRALDQKVRNLRTMLLVDEDITTELDKVVCRLMKLALHSSTGRQTPPPARWMQCKMLDLLTLTEKAISRRKKSFIEGFPLTADKHPDVLKQDTRVKELVNKYRHLIQPLEKTTNTEENNDLVIDVDIEDEYLSTTSNEFSKENEFVVEMSPSLVIPRPLFSTESFCTETFKSPEPTPDATPLERTKAWLAEDVEVEPYPKHEMNYEDISSDDTDHSGSKVRNKHKISIKKRKTSSKSIRESVADPKTSLSKTSCKFKIKREFRKNSKTLIKNVARKKSSNNNVVEYLPGEYDNCVLGSEIKNSQAKIAKPTFNVAASKPIPESLIALCQPDLKAEKGTKSPEVTDNADKTNIICIPSSIAATEDSLHIEIITQDIEETIALRRTVGTDATVAPEIKRKLSDDNMSNDFDKKLCTKHEVSTENVQSQTIFLNDINEPSTSKGIRHNISTDVQCGPDSLAAYPLLSPCTSVVKMSQLFSTGIKINDVGADSTVKGTDFGTSTQETNNFETIAPRLRRVGINIKDSDVNLCSQNECSTMTISDPVSESPQTFATDRSLPVHSAVSVNVTELIKPMSSTLKIEDSVSEFWAPSIASMTQTFTDCMTVSKATSNNLIETFKSNVVSRINSRTKMTKLSCGAVHVHSYRDKQVSEDVVYQGAWQRYKPKGNTRKKTLNFSTLRRSNEAVARRTKEHFKEKKVNSKEKVYRKRQEKKQMEAEPMKPTQIQNVKLRKLSHEENSADVRKPRVSKSAAKISNITKGIPRPIKTTKVASKQSISTNTSKNAKSTFTIRRSGMLANVTANKKEIDKPQKLKKSYIPLYLKRTLQKDILNKSLDAASDAVRDSIDTLVNKIAPLVRSNTEEIRRDLLKFSDDLRENINYVVCRNDIEDKIKSPDEQTSDTSKDYNKSTPRQLDMLKRSHSPSHSINSSTCSSPNSVATVKAACTRTKVTTKRHSTPTYKLNVTNSESDNASPPKTKKMVKRYKAGKKTENKDIGNKENVPESTKNFVNKDKGKIIKAPFSGRPKSMCITQVETESSSPLLAHQKAQISNKSNVKISLRKDSDEKRKAISPSVSKKRSIKSETSIYDDFIQSESESFKTLDSTNMVLVIEPQQNYEDLSRTRNISRKSLTEFVIKSNHNLMEQLVHESSLHSDTSRSHILDSMRQILEETLDRIIISHGNVRHLSSQHTVILSNDDNIQEVNLDKVTSPGFEISIGVVKPSQDDIKNSLHRNFDSVLGDESTLSLNDTSLSVTDLDLLSFKSITSDSRYSEFYLADNELNTSQELDEIHTQNMTSVQDIFERKETHLTQTTPGTLAGQAFSGFSLDAALVAGDQPDSIAIVDSETGSMAVEINRQATSEELFISGRSSTSFDSCVLDEDVVVPNWLFQLISQQQSVEEDQEEPVLLNPVAAPLDEPMYDANGNIVEPHLLGVAAGAGDGRGMHSDHSQDSSGRGTSVSSSDTSSGLQSEVSTVLIDPSAQFELLRDPMTSSAVMPIDHQSSIDRTYGIEDEAGILTSSREGRARMINRASDIDADVSSIDTDAPDLSDN